MTTFPLTPAPIVAQANGQPKPNNVAPNHSEPSAAAPGTKKVGEILPPPPKKVIKKVVVAYSGGLDTSVIVTWLKNTYNCQVVTMTADVGQGEDELEGLKQKAKASGASEAFIVDVKKEFLTDFVFPCVRAGGAYEQGYLLGSSFARPLIAKEMIKIAKLVGADAVSHGCTGKGNDQVRFEETFARLGPHLQVVVPWREWNLTGRDDAVMYAEQNNIAVPVKKTSMYSRDRNIWHISHEGDLLEDPLNAPEEDMYMLSKSPMDAPDIPQLVTIGIEKGFPVALDRVRMDPVEMLTKLNEIGGENGIGRLDIVENRMVGIKSRGVYETPGGTILWEAVRQIEQLCLDRATMDDKAIQAHKYANLVYEGRWFDEVREATEAYMARVSHSMTGSVTLKLYKGNIMVESRYSPNTVYRQDISSFEEGSGTYNQADADGFIHLKTLPSKIRANLHIKDQFDA